MKTEVEFNLIGDNCLTLTEVKNYLRISNDVEDEVINRMTVSAIEWAEQYTGRSFREKEITALFTKLDGHMTVALPQPPIVSVEAVYTAHVDGTYSELSEGQYQMAGLSEKIITFPTVLALNGVLGYKVEYTVGETNNAQAKDAILKMIAEMYNTRGMSVEGTVSDATQLSAMKLLHPLRLRTLW